MQRRAFSARLGGAAVGLVVPRAARALPRAKPFRVGWLGVGTSEATVELTQAFKQAMRDLGYVEGSDVVYEYRWAHGMPDRLPGFAAELAALPVDLMVAGPNLAIAAALRATSTIPIVMVVAVDPVRSGFIQSLARPGGNVTGLTNDAGQEIQGKMLGLLKEMLPRVATVGVLVQQGLGYDRSAVEAAARQLDLRLHVNDTIRGSDEVEAAFDALVHQRVDAYFMIGGPVLYSRRQRVGELALARRLPGIHFARDWVNAGGLVSYGTSLPHQFRRAAAYVDKILKGAKPGDLPVELPSRFYLVVNRKTAKALGITIPQSLLLRADEVIE